MEILGHSGKKLAFKAFKNLAICGLVLGYNIHLIHEKLENNIPIVESIKNDYEVVSSTLSDSFVGLLKKAEGVSQKFYPDNKGYATGYGFNPTQNSPEYNRQILTFAEVNPETINFILKNANKYKDVQSKNVPEEFKQIKFTPEQINKMAIFAKVSYEKDFRTVLNEKLERKNFTKDKEDKILNNYLHMPSNQKSVLIHMVYKVGVKNLRKYNNFFNSLINYLDTPTLENKEKVALQFVYHYKSNGQTLLDTRVSKIHYKEFMKEAPKEVIDVKPIKKEDAPKSLTEEEKFNKAADDVRKDMLSNFSLTNIWNYLKSNKEQYDKTHENENNNIVFTRNKSQPVETMEVQYSEEESDDDQLYLYNEEDENVGYVIESSTVTVTRSINIRN